MQNSYSKIKNKENIITFLYFIFLILILIVFGYTPTNDGDGYIEFADVCISQGEPYPCTPLIKGHPFVWNIGAINIVAFIKWIFNSIYPLLIIYCLLKALSALLIYKIADKLFGNKTALIAMIIFVIYPNNWGQSTTILSEIPSIFLLLLGFLCCLNNKYFTSGICFAIANWIRAISIVFIFVITLYCLYPFNKQSFRKISKLLVGYFIFILFVGLESYHRTGYFIFQSDTLWFNMANVPYETDSKPHYNEEMFPKGTIRYIDNMEDKTSIECSEIWKERCVEWLKENKLKYLSKIPARIVYMYYDDNDNISAFLDNKSKPENNYITLPYKNILNEVKNLSNVQILAVVNFILYWITVLLALAGFIMLIKKHEFSKAYIICAPVIVGTLAITLAIHGETRFKEPFMPFIMILAAFALTELLKKRKLKS